MDNFNGLYAMKNVLSIEETPPVTERSFKVATKLRCELPTNMYMENRSWNFHR